ncbi:hypothetical protein ACFWOD_25410, partial [Streptomyces sp. NPDC058434]
MPDPRVRRWARTQAGPRYGGGRAGSWAADPVGSLDRATEGSRTDSARYREIMAPLGLGDELRAALE